MPEIADKFLACGVLEHGFARVRCDACALMSLKRPWSSSDSGIQQ
ncbi:MAG: hypothetical protein ACR2GK_11755 [Gemmatimonadaceae bacterium]